jgi:cytochrome c peroxidase
MSMTFHRLRLRTYVTAAWSVVVVTCAATLNAAPQKKTDSKTQPVITEETTTLAGAPAALGSVPVPLPPDLERYVRDLPAALVLGKALFWDMQVGSDGRTACATCHWHAGADVRPRNTLAPHGPGAPQSSTAFRGANYLLKPEDFPFYKLADPTRRRSKVLRDSSEVVGSQGIIRSDFLGVLEGSAVDRGRAVSDPVFQVSGVNVRQVTPRNALSVINAVYYDRQFWDGRASRYFNGVNSYGETDPGAQVWQYEEGRLQRVRILIDNASLASQAVGPPNHAQEMAWNGRTFPELGRKVLSLSPLALQRVDSTDSLLGSLANMDGNGLSHGTSYPSLIRQAFEPQWWAAPEVIDGEFTQMEANFSLFWGLSILLYEATLISDDSPYDRYAAGDLSALSPSAVQGLKLFLNQGKCINCHLGPEFAGGTVSRLRPIGGQTVQLIERMKMGDTKTAVYDNGYYNIGVRPTAEDLGVGGTGPFGPLSLSRRAEQGQNIGDPQKVKSGERLAIRGAFKTPTLRNIALTGPYFHNGGTLTLREVVEFYARGGDFTEKNMQDLDPDIVVLNDIVGNQGQIAALVDFMHALTDPRVEFQRAPFDHPELVIPNGHAGTSGGVAADANVVIPATGARGGARLKTFEQVLLHGSPL